MDNTHDLEGAGIKTEMLRFSKQQLQNPTFVVVNSINATEDDCTETIGYKSDVYIPVCTRQSTKLTEAQILVPLKSMAKTVPVVLNLFHTTPPQFLCLMANKHDNACNVTREFHSSWCNKTRGPNPQANTAVLIHTR
ncbi:unnamed protein product [Caretta caretta]